MLRHRFKPSTTCTTLVRTVTTNHDHPRQPAEKTFDATHFAGALLKLRLNVTFHWCTNLLPNCTLSALPLVHTKPTPDKEFKNRAHRMSAAMFLISYILTNCMFLIKSFEDRDSCRGYLNIKFLLYRKNSFCYKHQQVTPVYEHRRRLLSESHENHKQTAVGGGHKI